MEIVNFQKESGEQSGLRLVAEKKASKDPEIQKQFVSFQFLRIDPAWRKLDSHTKSRAREELQNVYESFRSQSLLFSYSLVGFDAKADLMFWRVGTSLDLVQDMTSALFQTELGHYLQTIDNYLSVTKNMMFTNGGALDRLHVPAGTKKYHFLYPCAKNKDWYEKTREERDAMIEENFMVGKRFTNISVHMTHAFGFSEHEYVISFETDEPRDFLALAEELQQTPSSRFALRGRPVYTCRQRSLVECLETLG
ncbi:MAG: chlorite dismutase family protein [Pyrinomonadaceae bacterium]